MLQPSQQTTSVDFSEWYRDQQPASEEWLRSLHAHPETGFEETWTAGFVADRLEELGVEFVTGLGGTGIVATVEGQGGPGRRIAFRAELDALPMDEAASVPYRSEVPGRFHGCGHDGHTVTVLTAAAYLATHRDFTGTAHFVFQPAEELLSGARAMLADGLLDRFPLDEAYALHNLPGLARGHIAVPPVAALSSADDVDVTIRAAGAHGAMPHTGQDAIAAAAHLIVSTQQTMTRVGDARDAGVLSFGRLTGGTVRNVLPAEVRLEGTLRTNDPALRDRLAALLDDAGAATARLFGVEISVSVAPVAPVTLNDATAAAAVADAAACVVGAERVSRGARGIMASEDFSEIAARVPSAYVFVGQGGHPPHHPEYVFDPEIIPTGAAIFAELARSRGTPTAASSPNTGSSLKRGN